MSDYRAIAKFKQQKNNKACFEAKAGPGKKPLGFLFEEINALKRQLKPKLGPERSLWASFSKKLMHLKGN
jgi:hypothetical protein